MSLLVPLATERRYIERINNIDVLLNYCMIRKPNPYGDRFTYYKLIIGSISSFYLKINYHFYHYFPTTILSIHPDLMWSKYHTYPNGNCLYVITKRTGSI